MHKQTDKLAVTTATLILLSIIIILNTIKNPQQEIICMIALLTFTFSLTIFTIKQLYKRSR